MSPIKTLKHWLWDAQIFAGNARTRPLVTLYAVIYAIIFPITFLAFMPHFAFLGPGLGEPTDDMLLTNFYQWVAGLEWSLTSQILAALCMALLLFGVVFRGWVIWRSYANYRDADGNPYPQHQVSVFALTNLVAVVGIGVTLLLIGAVLILLGGSLADGLNLIKTMSLWAHEQVMLHVPTLIELPPIIAVLVVYLLASFLHYWAHRLSHESRAAWLLFHRLHHVPPVLSPITTLPVYYAFPLFLIAVIPYNFAFAACTKLFSHDPLYMETVLFNLLVVISEIYGHSTATYHEGRRNPVIRWLGFTFINGPYHYLHHSSEAADAGRQGAVNMVNIGPGLFGMWDRLHGTYKPLREDKPPVGLTGQPPLHYNPVRMALSGPAQLLYELWHNKSWATRFRILFGHSAWNPPITRDYILLDGDPESDDLDRNPDALRI